MSKARTLLYKLIAFVASLGRVCWLRGAGFSLLSRGFSARPRAHCCGVLLSGTLSARDVGSRSTPHGFAYCKSSRQQRVGSPAGRYLSLSALPVLCRSSPGTALVSSRTGSSQQSLALWLRLAPSATPQCLPISDVRRVYIVDSFIARDPQHNAHTTSLFLTLSGHTFSG